MPYNKKTSIKDIAEAAGVSIATVSRVLNKSSEVREETAEKVLKTADDLNYHRDKVARRMRVKNADSLIFGLIITDVGNPFFSGLSKGVEDVAYRNEHVVLISNSDENPDREKFYIKSMLSEKVSGMIIAPTTGNRNYLRELVESGYPIIFIDRKLEGLDVDSVTIDNEAGAYKAVKHLIKLGHTRIGIINGIKGASTTEERFQGYKKALQEADVEIDPDLVVFENYKEAGGRRGMRKFLENGNLPTAVFSTNNLMTLGCIEEIYNHNLNISDDIAVVGFDDMPWAGALNPPLTAVKQPDYELGVTAAELLMERLRNTDHNTMNIVLNPELIVRKSCGVNNN